MQRSLTYDEFLLEQEKNIQGKLKYYCDNMRHLVCKPYSIENLHLMAQDLGIARAWFHKDHYDIPKKRIPEIQAKVNRVRPRDILMIIKGEDTLD